MWLEVLLTSPKPPSLLWFHPEPRMHLWGSGVGLEPGVPRVPALPPWPQAHSGTILSFQAAWEPGQEACHPQQALQARLSLGPLCSPQGTDC